MLLDYCQRFELDLIDRLSVPVSTPPMFLVGGEQYHGEEALEDFNAIRELLGVQADAVGYPAGLPRSPLAAQELDFMSVSEWIEAFVPGGSASRLGRLLESTYTIEFGCDAKRQSAVNIIEMLSKQRSSETFDVLGWSTERYKVKNGLDQIPQRLAQSLPEQCMQYESPIVELRVDGQQAVLVVDEGSRRSEERFDSVIIAIPFSTLRNVELQDSGFDERKLHAINSLGYGWNTKLQLEFTGRPWVESAPVVGDGTIFSDADFQGTWESTFAQDTPTAVFVCYQGGELGASAHADDPFLTTPSEEVSRRADSFLRELEEIWPSISSAYTGTATLTSPMSPPWARGSYACRLVGQYTSFFGHERAPQGPFLFAGEHCTGRHHMEFAARSGADAAYDVLATATNATQPR